MSETKPTKTKKVFSIIGTVLSYLFMVICLVVLILTITAKKDADGATTIFGRQIRIVLSSSMEKCDQTDVSAFEIKDIPVKSVVYVQTVPKDETKAAEWYSNLKVGDVLTFRYMYAKQETITHRIVEITPNASGGYTIILEGDNKASDSGVGQQIINTADENSYNYVIGKVTGTSYGLGVVLTAVKSPVGMVLIVIVPCLAIALIEIVRIVDILNKGKKEKALAEKQAKEDELAQLKQQLEQLKAQQPATDESAPKAADETAESAANNSTSNAVDETASNEENKNNQGDK